MASGDRRTYAVDCDEDENPLEDTKVYPASTVNATSPVGKEISNVGRMRKDNKARRNSASPTTATALTDSDSTTHPGSPLRRETKMKSKDKSRQRERESSSSSRSTAKNVTTRPPAKHSKTAPVINTNVYRRPHDEPSCYGVPTTALTSARQRAHSGNQRPATYYGSSPDQSRPPMSSLRYRQSALPAFGTSFPPQAPYPPPSAMPYPSPYAAPSPQPVPTGDYFGSSPHQLAARFSLNRPRSAMGHRVQNTIAYDDYDQENDGGVILRRQSLTRKSTRPEEDRRRMPPPPRPITTRPRSMQSPFAPPPIPSHHRRSVDYDAESFDDDESSYQGVSPMTTYDYSGGFAAPRRPSIDSHDSGRYHTEVAGKRSRRNSVYTVPSADEKMRYHMQTVSNYQEEVEGGPTPKLTAEALRKVTKTPSRSTKSTGSRDESGYNRSGTTRTSVDNDDINIIVKGTATLKVGNAEMECRDGAEINISSRSNPSGTVRGSSDNTGSVYDDQRGRIGRRPPMRTRASSQAGYYRPIAPVPFYDQYGQPLLPSSYHPEFM